MPLLFEGSNFCYHGPSTPPSEVGFNSLRLPSDRRQSKNAVIAAAKLTNLGAKESFANPEPSILSAFDDFTHDEILKAMPSAWKTPDGSLAPSNPSNGASLTDTPMTTANSSPRIPPLRQDSVSSIQSRTRPTTLDIPGLTKSKVSPDGRIAQRDVGSKLVIVMVGLPARGKSYVTKKVARYLNWLQHDTKIFNVGERRREAAGAPVRAEMPSSQVNGLGIIESTLQAPEATPPLNGILSEKATLDKPTSNVQSFANGKSHHAHTGNGLLPPPALDTSENWFTQSAPSLPNGNTQRTNVLNGCPKFAKAQDVPKIETLDQSANFFDPENEKASQLREQVAMSTLDELLDYILDQGGSVGIFDATNSTLKRRKLIMSRIRERAGPELGVLFLESLCVDENLLESNMRLKLSGPDYRDQDPITALADFKKRVALYEKNYVPLGDYEERNDMPYVQMIDVGRKVVSHQIRGFLSAQTVYYLLNFNLSPRQIWITRHGESLDNVNGKIGGDSELSANGQAYGKALARFIRYQRQAWEFHQLDKAMSTHFPPRPGDATPPNPEYSSHSEDNSLPSPKNFCVWTSMLKRSIETAQDFDVDGEFDVKQMKMLDELYAGTMEGLTYQEIKSKHSAEYALRKRDKLHYRYPGPGGEGYLDIINRLRTVIVEIERMTDHVLLVGHRSVARVLLAYFRGLKREDVADLDVPLGMLYVLEPKPYGVQFKAYQYDRETDWFHEVPDYELRSAASHLD